MKLYLLKTNKLFAKEQLIFNIQNYIQGVHNKVKPRIDSLEGNTSKQPKIKVEEVVVIVDILDIENDEPKELIVK